MCSPQWSASPPSVSSSLLLLSYKRSSALRLLSLLLRDPHSFFLFSPPSPPPLSFLLLLLLLLLLISPVGDDGGQQFSSSLSETPRTELYSLETLTHIIFRFSRTCEAFMSKDSEIFHSTRCSAASSSSPAKINSSSSILMKHWADRNYSNRYWIRLRKLQRPLTKFTVRFLKFSWGGTRGF